MTDFILILAGVSGVGKTTVAAELALRNPRFKMSRSHTTRAKRGDGRDSEYIYVTKEQFLELVSQGEMLEYTEYSGMLYGTSKKEIYSILSEGNIPLLVLDYNGVKSFRSHRLEAPVVAVYIYSSLAVAKERLLARANFSGNITEANAVAEERQKVNIADFLDIKNRVKDFDFLIENSNLDLAVNEILALTSNLDSVKSQTSEYKSAIANKLYIDAIKSQK